MDGNQSKGQPCPCGASTLETSGDSLTDENAVLDQLSEHFKQINDILALVESEHSREIELAVNCDLSERLTPPSQGLPSPGLQSSLTSPLNAHVIEDLIRDSVQDNSVINSEYANAIEDLSTSFGSPDDPESRTRRTLQTLAQLAELVDKNNLALSAESSDSSKACEISNDSLSDANKSKSGKESTLAKFRPEKPILLISKVRAGLELLKRRQIAKAKSAQKQKKKTLTCQENFNSCTSKLSETNNTQDSVITLRTNDEQYEQTPNQLQNVIFVQNENNQLIPMEIVAQENQLNDSSITSIANSVPISNQPVIFIPYNLTKFTDIANDAVEGSGQTQPDAQPFILIPPIIVTDQTQAETNVSSEQGDLEGAQGQPEQLGNVSVVSEDSSNSADNSLRASYIAETSSDGSEDSFNVRSNKDEFKCQYCSSTFNRFCNFAKHQLVHNVFFSEDDVYKCEYCERKFLQRCDLNRHLLVHNGTEPYRCEICNKAYIRKSDLVVHLRYHTKEKPFTCKICSKAFAQSGDLNRHVRRVHEKAAVIRCGHCKRKYAKEATLIRHMKIAHQDVILQSIVAQQPD